MTIKSKEYFAGPITQLNATYNFKDRENFLLPEFFPLNFSYSYKIKSKFFSKKIYIDFMCNNIHKYVYFKI